MTFFTQYDLLEQISGGNVRSFKARHRDTGQDVRVHFLSGAHEEILRRVQSLSTQRRSIVLKQGEHEGKIYVVTLPLPGGVGFEQWLNESDGEEKRSEFSRKGQWDIQDLQSKLNARREAAKATPPPPPAPAAPPKSEPGEFTKMFGPSAAS